MAEIKRNMEKVSWIKYLQNEGRYKLYLISFFFLDYLAMFSLCVLAFVPTAWLCCSLDFFSLPSHEVKALMLFPKL